MKREIRTVDAERGIVQQTLPDERWYCRQISVEGTAENKTWDFVPSTSWVASYYPKDVRFYKWLSQRSWDESEEIKAMRGDQGSKVHQAIRRLLEGGSVDTDNDKFENPRTLMMETLGSHEVDCLMSFREWFKSEQPDIEVIACEYTVWNEKHRYAGTIDLKCRLGKRTLQGAEGRRYTRRAGTYNKKKKWKFVPIQDQFPLFLAVRKIWKKETAKVVVPQRDYPLSLSLGI